MQRASRTIRFLACLSLLTAAAALAQAGTQTLRSFLDAHGIYSSYLSGASYYTTWGMVGTEPRPRLPERDYVTITMVPTSLPLPATTITTVEKALHDAVSRTNELAGIGSCAAEEALRGNCAYLHIDVAFGHREQNFDVVYFSAPDWPNLDGKDKIALAKADHWDAGAGFELSVDGNDFTAGCELTAVEMPSPQATRVLIRITLSNFVSTDIRSAGYKTVTPQVAIMPCIASALGIPWRGEFTPERNDFFVQESARVLRKAGQAIQGSDPARGYTIRVLDALKAGLEE